jgi:hypothetical protein
VTYPLVSFSSFCRLLLWILVQPRYTAILELPTFCHHRFLPLPPLSTSANVMRSCDPSTTKPHSLGRPPPTFTTGPVCSSVIFHQKRWYQVQRVALARAILTSFCMRENEGRIVQPRARLRILKFREVQLAGLEVSASSLARPLAYRRVICCLLDRLWSRINQYRSRKLQTDESSS